MATPPEPEFRAHLRALGDKYLASVPERMAAIEQAVARAGDDPDHAALESVHLALHTVAGSAGSFGFTALGNEARRLEQAVRPLLAGNAGWPELVPQIRRYLAWAAKNPQETTFSSHD